MLTKFLVIRFSSIGDIVLTTPVVRCLKQQYPNAEIHYLTKPAFAGILAHNPYITQVHTLDKALLKKARELKSLGFDYIIDLHNNLRTSIIKSVLQVPAFSFDKLNIEKSIAVKLKQGVLPPIHIVQRYLATLSPFHVKADNKGLDYFLPPSLLQEWNYEAVVPTEPFIAFAIGAQHATKRLPTDKIILLVKGVQKKVVLLGGKEDVEAANAIAAQCGNTAINLCGTLSLHQSAFVLSQAEKVVTHDTGLMHIAAALNKEIISIWGNTIPEFGMTPYYGHSTTQHHLFQVPHLNCRPCSKIGFKQCPKAHFNCMNLQPTHHIIEVINGK
ncbi:MAG: glycosyltransferase family 9 protein [Bacteroidetes bacterium]|nr:MAG: glycosyltransferase family 9 protein [Bacteroidota bacterium]